ncbi:MAG: hypothetical protein HFG80_03165 [Eubacterium sp.]|nr:hypothetical protein [Eubacterium sp.]
MTIGGINHIGINTEDFQASIAFYRDIMNMEILGEYDLGGDYVAYVKVDEKSTIELFRNTEYPADQGSAGERPGLKHLAFHVDDVDAWEKHLREKGYTITFGPADLPVIRQRVMLFEAPDHVILELCTDMKS